MHYSKEGYYYPPWLVDQDCGDEYKRKLILTYDEFFNEENPEQKKAKLDELRVYLTVVCDIIAYRYLVKHYSNLFYRLSLTIEEYMDYKVDRMYLTIKDKKTRIEDIISYIYISFMLSSPRLIYDYAEKMGRCQQVKQEIPYFQTQRYKFFFIEREKTVEHIIFNVENTELDEESEAIRSNIDKYSLHEYEKAQSQLNFNSGLDRLITLVESLDTDYENSRTYLLKLFRNWERVVEGEFEALKRTLKIKDEFTIFDYIRYNYEEGKTGLNYNEYLEVLNILNNIIKRGGKI